MEQNRDKPVGMDGRPYIWLRYTTQFTTAGRTHTLEMGIPVPLGASAEERERLIREAEMGMEQLTQHVDGHVNQVLQRTTRTPQSSQEPFNRNAAGTTYPQGTTAQSSNGAPAPAPLARTSVQSTPAQAEAQPAAQSVRHTIGANMPSTPGIPGDANGNMKIGQFIQFIRETWGLTPKQAMDLLQVKTLNGLNYREVLRQLQPLVEQNGGGAPAPGSKPAAASSTRPVEKASNSPAPAPSSSPAQVRVPANEKVGAGQVGGGGSRPAPTDSASRPASPTPMRPAPAGGTTPQPGAEAPPPAATAKPNMQSAERKSGSPASAPAPVASPASTPNKAPVIPIRMVRDEGRPYRFDEEEDEENEEEELDIDAIDIDNSEQQRAMARIKLDELKEVKGTSAANPGRLTVLHNVLNSQISDAQLQRLMEAAWGVTSEKKLKVDQVEALISWAKEDYFVDEAEAVLALIDEEESHARSDW